MSEWTDETLRYLKGAPHENLSPASIAERIGVEEHVVRDIIEALLRDGLLVRDGDRLIVVEGRA
jgi:DNA-binding GntR family transcriptional regulator